MLEPSPLTLIIDTFHNNQYLFADHYLNHLLRADPRWAEALPQAERFLAWLRELYDQQKELLPHYSEAQLEEHWIKPILLQLGHRFESQAVIPGLVESSRRPDYVFFATEAEQQAAILSQNTADYAAQALAVGDAKKWAIPLGPQTGRRPGAGRDHQPALPASQRDGSA